MTDQNELFSDLPSKRKPLAEKLRPQTLEEFAGLAELDPHFVTVVKKAAGRPPSIVLWGQPGTGKTTLAKLIGKRFRCRFVEMSAVLSGVKELREVMAEAKKTSVPTVLFVDEIHRFNKSQQDALLPHIEVGTVAFVGATTENPSFYLTPALNSRVRIVVVPPLAESAAQEILLRVERELGFSFEEPAKLLIIEASGGDGRRLITLAEEILLSHGTLTSAVNAETTKAFLGRPGQLFYDRSGEEHYNVVSAFIKSMRGSDPDGALYWAFRMIESGEDPLFVLRRMVIFASEDIGNADPHALTLAVSALQAYERLGLPEGKYPIAHCITYLASAPKSNRSNRAMQAAIAAAKQFPKVAVPLHLRNAPTTLMKNLGYGAEYQYPHDYEEGYVGGVTYLPKELEGKKFYHPSQIGQEGKIFQRLAAHTARSEEKRESEKGS